MSIRVDGGITFKVGEWELTYTDDAPSQGIGRKGIYVTLPEARDVFLYQRVRVPPHPTVHRVMFYMWERDLWVGYCHVIIDKLGRVRASERVKMPFPRKVFEKILVLSNLLLT